MRLLKAIIVAFLFLQLNILAQIPKSDRQIAGLQGPVKIVVTERVDKENVEGRRVESKRKAENLIEYDAEGNRRIERSYDYAYGLLREVAVYKIIDGDKVVVYEDDNAPGKIISEAPISKTRQEFDPRYAFKFKYKYDPEGNVLEEAWWKSNGSPWLRYVYVIKGNQKEVKVFSTNGSLNQKHIYTLDSKGNEMQILYYDTKDDKISSKETFKYLEFDAMGNWTKRLTSEGDEETKFAQQPREIKYRKLSYF